MVPVYRTSGQLCKNAIRGDQAINNKLSITVYLSNLENLSRFITSDWKYNIYGHHEIKNELLYIPISTNKVRYITNRIGVKFRLVVTHCKHNIYGCIYHFNT